MLNQVNSPQQILVESKDLQECNTVIVFCPINSRVRSDVEAAMAKAPGTIKLGHSNMKCVHFYVICLLLFSLTICILIFYFSFPDNHNNISFLMVAALYPFKTVTMQWLYI